MQVFLPEHSHLSGKRSMMSSATANSQLRHAHAAMAYDPISDSCAVVPPPPPPLAAGS